MEEELHESHSVDDNNNNENNVQDEFVPSTLEELDDEFFKRFGQSITTLDFIREESTRELYKLIAIKTHSTPFAVLQADHAVIGQILARSGTKFTGLYCI